MKSKLTRWGLTVVTMVSVATVVLLVTGWGSAAASATMNVIVGNTASNPVPVHETNTDASGNIKVHEQGTASVNVTNTSVPVRGNLTVSQSPITGGGGRVVGCFGDEIECDTPSEVTATALEIDMGPTITSCSLATADGTVVADFNGPAFGGRAHIAVPLSRPISFEKVEPSGGNADTCSVSWVGDSP